MKGKTVYKEKPTRIYVNAQVSAVDDITPSLRRVTFKNEQFKDAVGCLPGMHLKIFLPRLGQVQAELPELIDGRPGWGSEVVKPIVRTYTIRHIDHTNGELSIEFFLHGDEGCAAGWAYHVSVGDILGIGLKPGKTLPNAEWYLFAGDETAIPAIAGMLESLPKTAQGTALLEVGSAADTFHLITRSEIKIRWFGRNGESAKDSTLLLNALKDIVLPDPEIQKRLIWIAGESTQVQAMRTYAFDSLYLKKDELRAAVYWKAGFAEDEILIDRNAG